MADGILQLVCECKVGYLGHFNISAPGEANIRVQHDPWGKQGESSLAGRLWSHMPDTEKLDASETYSEMWMGTYPSVPSRVRSTGKLLSEHLKENPDLVGSSICDRYGPDIPFLPKILSFAKALPLQIHPDKSLAERLHEKDPERFGDANHKPEIAIALSRFELFVGFKPLSEIAELMRLKPLEQFVPEHKSFDEGTLRQLCETLLKLGPGGVSETLTKLQETSLSEFGDNENVPSLLDRLSKQYSKFDNGNLIAALLMNYMVLEPGEAVCVPADGIHAWFSGDIMECMARSDNVLNTGFCPRVDRDDVELFSQALTFRPNGPKESLLGQKKSFIGVKGRTVEYAPPFSEFNVLGVTLSPAEVEKHKVLGTPSILVVTQGSGKMNVGDGAIHDIEEGNVYFAAKDAALDLSTKTGLVLYRTYATF
ncbi:Mannose-6-phosphate isomerase [Penicillium italicum]|uniref:Mannose-6-phosphate isomerase n=1 Tax=Penicillium italicum TaxID=40296 RepID=A0A0A2KIC1_PENIT|nr:Mannose-6-phosphate isomerase [Penicillium italicum]